MEKIIFILIIMLSPLALTAGEITNEGLKALVMNFEGCRLTAYKCPANVTTIGYGHTGGVKPGTIITKAQAIELLKSDIKKFENYVNKVIGMEVLPREFDTYTDHCFNTGYTLKGELLTFIKSNAKNLIRAKMNLYCHARVNGELRVLKGLQRRCQARVKWHEFGRM